MDVCSALREKIYQAGDSHRVRVVKSGCLAQCGHGPVVAVEPSGEWFCRMRAEDGSTLGGWLVGEEDLPEELLDAKRYSPGQPGKNVLAEKNWPIPPDSAVSP